MKSIEMLNTLLGERDSCKVVKKDSLGNYISVTIKKE